MDFGSTTKDFTRSAEAGEGDTIFARKRLRRVSFADTTAIHFFDRDEDVETPPDPKVGAEGSSQSGLGNEPLGFHGEGTDNEDTRSSPRREEDGVDDDDDEDGGDEDELFVRRYGDSSSPCSTAGSVSSNDGDNLFGPVSTSFIRSGGLSEVSDDNNHDITLDSTAFSMHFSNILPLDDRSINSVETPRTPTGLSVTNDSGNFVLHSDAKKMSSRFGLLKANGYSSDMTLVAEHSNRYDYGKLSPTLEVLLAKVNETIQPQSRTDESKPLSSYKSLADDPGASVSEKILSNSDAVASTSRVELRSGEHVEVCQNDEHHCKDATNALGDSLHVSNGFPEALTSGVSGLHRSPANTGAGLPAGASSGEIDHENITSTHMNAKDDVYKEKPSTFVSDNVSNANVISSPSVQSQKHYSSGSHFRDKTPENEHRSKISQVFASDSPAQMTMNGDRSVSFPHEGRMYTPTGYQNTNRTLHSTSEASISSLRTKRRQLLDDASRPFESEQKLSFSGVQSALSSKTKVIRDSERTSLIKNCSAEFENFELEGAGSKSRSQLSTKDHRLHGLKSKLDENGSKGGGKRLDISVGWREEQGMDIAGRGANMEMDHEIHVNRHGTPANLSRSSHYVDNNVIFETSKQAEEITQIPKSGIRKDVKSRNFDNFTEKHASSPASSYSREQILDVLESKHAGSTFRTLISSPKSILGQKHSIQKEQCFTPFVNDSVKSNSLLNEMKPETPISHVPCSSNEVRKLDNQNTLPEACSFHISGKKRVIDSRNSNPDSQDRNHQVRKDVASIVETLADQSPTFSSSSDAHKEVMSTKLSEDTAEAMLRTRGDPTLSSVSEHGRGNDIPSVHLRNTASKDPMLNVRVDTSQDVCSPKKSSSSLEEGISAKKRSKQDPPSTDTIDDPGRSSKCSKSTSISEILTRIVESTRLPFSQLANRLDLQELDVLEDLVCQLKNARKYETLCSHIQTLAKNPNLDQQKRLSEISLLKETLLYEQARRQLRSIKHDRLLKKAQELQSRIHDISKLRLSFMQLIGKQSDIIPASDPKSVAQEGRDKVAPMRQKLEETDEKIKSLVKFFGAHYNNVTGILGHDEVIQVISGHFSKWNDCRAVCQRLQLWKLVDVMNETDQCDIVLNYCNFFSHRFTIAFTPASRFGVELSMNDANIEKIFPNMRASAAFDFAFSDSKGNRRLSSIRCFQNEIQAASFILGNLLDVLEEIQSAQIQVSSLMSSTFSAHSDGQLELQLHFVDLKTGRKMVLTLDMTQLKCAVYPSEPSELHVAVLCSPPAPEDVVAAVRSLKGGRPALLRLCRHVSQLIQGKR